jgi:hypothetical protein
VAHWLAAEAEADEWIKAHPDDAAVVLDKYVFDGKQLALAKAVLPKLISTYLANTPREFKMARAPYEGAVNAAKTLGLIGDPQLLSYAKVVIASARDDN